jgi:hypothetical protein
MFINNTLSRVFLCAGCNCNAADQVGGSLAAVVLLGLMKVIVDFLVQ